MEKAITTILITVASVVAMLVVINATFPTVTRTSGAISAAGAVLTERIKTDVEIVHAGGDNGSDTAYVWAKNIGSARVGALDQADLFFGADSAFERLPYGQAGCPRPLLGERRRKRHPMGAFRCFSPTRRRCPIRYRPPRGLSPRRS